MNTSRAAGAVLALTLCIGTVAFPQDESPNVLRAEARALAVADLRAMAETADKDQHSQLILGIALELMAERVTEFDANDRRALRRAGDHWLRKAASGGSTEAQYFLAVMTVRRVGSGGPVDCDEVDRLLNSAVEKNYVPALTEQGRLHLDGGCGFTVNSRLALELLRRASDGGDTEANCIIGDAYQQGRGVKANQQEANRWYLRGAQLGAAACQDSIGVSLAEGNGTQPDSKQAVAWFQKSADQGNYSGACNLAIHYMRGEGVQRDNVSALMWVLISDRTNPGSIYCSEHFELEGLTDEQKSEATKRADEWLAAHHYPPTSSLTGWSDLVKPTKSE